MSHTFLPQAAAVTHLAVAVAPAVAAEATLAAVMPQAPCASLRTFAPAIPDGPTQITDAREALVGAT